MSDQGLYNLIEKLVKDVEALRQENRRLHTAVQISVLAVAAPGADGDNIIDAADNIVDLAVKGDG